MPLSLQSVSERLEAAIRAHYSARSSADEALALLQLDAALTQALQQWLLAQPTLAPDLAATLSTTASPLPQILQAGPVLNDLLTENHAAALLALDALCQRLLAGGAGVTPAELLEQGRAAAQLALDLWPRLSDRPTPQVEGPFQRPPNGSAPSDLEQAQQELQRQRQRALELEQNSQRQSRALAAANNEVDRLRGILAGANKQESASPVWQQGLQSLLIGLLFIGIGLAAFFLARLALNLPWPWLFSAFLIVLGLPVGLYAGIVYAVRGIRKLSPDRLLGYAAILLLLAFLTVALLDRSSDRFSERAGTVATRWISGALRSPLTLIQASLQAPAPFITALRGRSPTNPLQKRIVEEHPTRPKGKRQRPYLPESVDEFEFRYLTMVQEQALQLDFKLFDGSEVSGQIIGFSPYAITIREPAGTEVTIQKLAIAYYRHLAPQVTP